MSTESSDLVEAYNVARREDVQDNGGFGPGARVDDRPVKVPRALQAEPAAVRHRPFAEHLELARIVKCRSRKVELDFVVPVGHLRQPPADDVAREPCSLAQVRAELAQRPLDLVR